MTPAALTALARELLDDINGSMTSARDIELIKEAFEQVQAATAQAIRDRLEALPTIGAYVHGEQMEIVKRDAMLAAADHREG